MILTLFHPDPYLSTFIVIHIYTDRDIDVLRTRGRTQSNSACRQRRPITAARGLSAPDRRDGTCHTRLAATGLDTAAGVAAADTHPAVAAAGIAGSRPAADTAGSPAAARTVAGRRPAASADRPAAACPDTSPPDTVAPARDIVPCQSVRRARRHPRRGRSRRRTGK